MLVIAVVIGAPRGAVGLLRRRRPAAPLEPVRAPVTVTQRTAPQPRGSDPPLEVRGATKRFGGLVAVNAVSFALESGSLTSVIGPNGAGKTTLFNAIGGIGRLSEGSVHVGGVDVTGWQPHRIAALGIGRTFQNARLFGEMTVLENVLAGAFRTERSSFGADLLALPVSRRAARETRDRAYATLQRLALEPLAATAASELPFGDRRRVELARAIAAGPDLLLVDEPAAGLSAAERARLRDDLLALRASGMTLLLIEHDMRLVMAISDRVMVLEFGRLIADGSPAVVRADPAVVGAYLGTGSGVAG
jgi:ABC-type branched-subunit amino acid transport system ATPase component